MYKLEIGVLEGFKGDKERPYTLEVSKVLNDETEVRKELTNTNVMLPKNLDGCLSTDEKTQSFILDNTIVNYVKVLRLYKI